MKNLNKSKFVIVGENLSSESKMMNQLGKTSVFYKTQEEDIVMNCARYFVAKRHGYNNWSDVESFVPKGSRKMNHFNTEVNNEFKELMKNNVI